MMFYDKLNFTKNNKSFLIILGVGIILRLVIILLKGGYTPEEYEYSSMAQNLLNGDGYVYTHLSTEYRSFISGFIYVWILTIPHYFGNKALFLLTSLAISLVQALFLFLLCKKIFNTQVGLISSFLMLTHPGLVYYEINKIHPLGFDSFLLISSLFLLICLEKSSSVLLMISSGLILGLSSLQRTTLLPFVFAVTILTYLRKKPKKAFYIFLGFIIIFSPWIARNYLIHEKFIIASTSSEHLWRGNVPWSQGTSYLTSGKTVLNAAPEEFLIKLYSNNELGQMDLFKNDLAKYFWSRPTTFLSGILKKFIHFWTFAPSSGILYPEKYFYFYYSYYLLILLFSIMGEFFILYQGANKRISYFFLLVFILFLSISFVNSVFYFEIRHRWALEPLILILSSVGILACFKVTKILFQKLILWKNLLIRLKSS